MYTNQPAGFIQPGRQDALENYCKIATATESQLRGTPQVALNTPGFVITDALCYGCTNRPDLSP